MKTEVAPFGLSGIRIPRSTKEEPLRLSATVQFNQIPPKSKRKQSRNVHGRTPRTAQKWQLTSGVNSST